jgi:Zn-dependent peptidase ImmA (M78 family)
VYCRPADVDQAEAGVRRREREANRFAAELLMPETLVRASVERDGVDPHRLAGRFAVSDVAMGFRLVNLGYLTALPAAIDEEYRRWRVAPDG